MHRSRQRRDSHGRFIRNVSPPQQEPSPPTPSPAPAFSRPNRLQRILTAATTPLTSSVPISEFVANIAMAFHTISPKQDALAASAAPVDSPSSLVRPIPPPGYVSNPPLPRPDFNAPGSDESSPPAALNNAFINDEDIEDNHYLQPYTPDSDDASASSDDDQLLPQALPPLQSQTPPHSTFHIRALPLPLSHSCLAGPLPLLLSPHRRSTYKPQPRCR